MRQVIKFADSEIIRSQLAYKSGNNDQLRELLAQEQHSICAYTETYLATTDDAHIEHFNPTLKDTADDGYSNWFLVKALWNVRKATKWANYQPVLHPTADDLSQRILYFDGNYVAADPADTDAVNLIRLLNLDNARLADERRRYIASKRSQITNLNIPAQQYFSDRMQDYPEGVYFIRALEEELAVTINFDLLKTT
jgi:uncharacterized protein (TIGR02646 family)